MGRHLPTHISFKVSRLLARTAPAAPFHPFHTHPFQRSRTKPSSGVEFPYGGAHALTALCCFDGKENKRERERLVMSCDPGSAHVRAQVGRGGEEDEERSSIKLCQCGMSIPSVSTVSRHLADFRSAAEYLPPVLHSGSFFFREGGCARGNGWWWGGTRSNDKLRGLTR
jgi:hypothetical protein